MVISEKGYKQHQETLYILYMKLKFFFLLVLSCRSVWFERCGVDRTTQVRYVKYWNYWSVCRYLKVHCVRFGQLVLRSNRGQRITRKFGRSKQGNAHYIVNHAVESVLWRLSSLVFSSLKWHFQCTFDMIDGRLGHAPPPPGTANSPSSRGGLRAGRTLQRQRPPLEL